MVYFEAFVNSLNIYSDYLDQRSITLQSWTCTEVSNGSHQAIGINDARLLNGHLSPPDTTSLREFDKEGINRSIEI